MQNRFFAMLARMKLIRRWGLMFSTRDENLSEHSLDTAFFMHALLSLHNRRRMRSSSIGLRSAATPTPVWPPQRPFTTTRRRSSPATCPPR
mgnify:CR=1 FL=1